MRVHHNIVQPSSDRRPCNSVSIPSELFVPIQGLRFQRASRDPTMGPPLPLDASLFRIDGAKAKDNEDQGSDLCVLDLIDEALAIVGDTLAMKQAPSSSNKIAKQ